MSECREPVGIPSGQARKRLCDHRFALPLSRSATLSTRLWLYDTISAYKKAQAPIPTSAFLVLFSGRSRILAGGVLPGRMVVEREGYCAARYDDVRLSWAASQKSQTTAENTARTLARLVVV